MFDGGTLPVAGDLTQTAGAPAANVVVTLPVAPVDGDAFVDFQVAVTADFTTFPSFTLDPGTTGWTIRDVSNTLGGGGTTNATVATRDSNDGSAIGSDADAWLSGAFGVTQGAAEAISSTTATIDVATAWVNFVAAAAAGPAADTLVDDRGATVGYEPTTPGVLAPGGGPYALVATDYRPGHHRGFKRHQRNYL